MVCHHCGVKGHGINECPELTYAQRKQFWEYCNKDRRQKANTSSKEVSDNAYIAEVVAVVPAEYDAVRINYEHYQRLVSMMEELDIGMFHVGHSDTVVVEDMDAGVNILSPEILIPVRECLGIRAQKASINGLQLTRTSSNWTVVRLITPHF